MKRKVTDYVTLKAWIDVFNEKGHKGFSKPLEPLEWWGGDGKIKELTDVFIKDGLVVILDKIDKKTVKNLLVFSLCKQKDILKKILDICKNYDTVNYNAEFRNKYKFITRKLGGTDSTGKGRFIYAARGGEAWERLYG